MKKIFLFLTIILLSSCSFPINDKDNNTKEEEIIKVYNYDDLPYEAYKPYKESYKRNNVWSIEGDGSLTSDINKKIIKVNSGTLNIKSSPFMMKNGNYKVTFKASNKGHLKIASNDGIYLDIDFDKGEKLFEYQIEETNYETVVTISVDSDTNIDDFSIESNPKTYGAITNQVTYLDNLNKAVVFNNNPGNYYGIYNASDDTLVYLGDVSEAIFENDTNQWLYKGYFDEFNIDGDYYIKTELGYYSDIFSISDSYNDLLDSALNAIYVQRCGFDTSGDLGHPACHTSYSKIFSYTKEEYLDTIGGWHDAGDYGKYGIIENKVIADLLFTYLYADNKDPNLVDEIKYGLNYILKLQDEYGAVYNKVVSKNFAPFISPEDDTAQTYLLYPWTSVTASFAGITGLAYEAFKDSDEELASYCLEAFNRSIEYLYNNQSASNQLNPDGFDVGTYYVTNETDERLFAYSVAYKITKDDKYKELCSDLLNEGIDSDDLVANCRLYAYITLLDCLEYDSDLYNLVKATLKNECESISEGVSANVYSYPYFTYLWGSNQHVCEAINKLLLASRYFNDQKYVVKASEMINYILGLNVLDLCFVYGYGYHYPNSIHSRLAYAKNAKMIKGAMCNGVDQYLTDGEIGKYFNEDSPIATRFVDNSDSYSNVEPAINYNSALYLSLNLLEYANNKPLN